MKRRDFLRIVGMGLASAIAVPAVVHGVSFAATVKDGAICVFEPVPRPKFESIKSFSSKFGMIDSKWLGLGDVIAVGGMIRFGDLTGGNTYRCIENENAPSKTDWSGYDEAMMKYYTPSIPVPEVTWELREMPLEG